VIDAPSLPEFCAEMQRLALVIEAPAESLPPWGGPAVDGTRIDLGADAAYVLIYTEKGVPDVLARSADPETFMEQVFIDVTARMAEGDPSLMDPPTEDPFQLPPLPEIRTRALRLQAGLAAIQLRLMTRLNPVWGERQAARNAARKHQIEALLNDLGKQ
jgi:hypothetical protein